MSNLDVDFLSKTKASVMDKSGIINLTDYKWTPLFDFCNELFDGVYFLGYRTQFLDDEFEKTIEYLSEETVILDEKRLDILIKIKQSSLQLNRGLFSKLWNYYEFPSLVYLGDASDEPDLIRAYKYSTFHEDVVNNINHVFIMYQLTQEDVIWMQTNIGIMNIISLIKEY